MSFGTSVIWFAAAVNTTSDELFNAVSNESCNTPIIKPIPTTCIAMSLEIPGPIQFPVSKDQTGSYSLAHLLQDSYDFALDHSSLFRFYITG